MASYRLGFREQDHNPLLLPAPFAPDLKDTGDRMAVGGSMCPILQSPSGGYFVRFCRTNQQYSTVARVFRTTVQGG